MKPETRIALVKMAEQAKRIQAGEYTGRWVKMGYVGAVVTSSFGLLLMSSAIVVISKGGSGLLGPLYLLATLLLTLMPWYFLLRYTINRKIALLCEAILSVNQSEKDVSA